ncbi:hypothetical protein [Spirosoma fluviale]|uniref:Uncharacterized protein n=1 Tax=Spirosoma fluviale TaxID=1597977 RepID=A0A286FFT0_9BACT|nr:hypothetical protein [Spirosoma fluviale]SOD82062.1 hypothetical protein SAMN06269250_2008 [Spirosoma fluviale]
MLVLDMSQRLQQSLLTHFLQSRGLRVETRETIRPADWPSTILLTDKLPRPAFMPAYGRQIWMLTQNAPVADSLPDCVKGLLSCDCDLTELETCVQQVLLRQSYFSPGLLSHSSRRINSMRAKVVSN